MGMGPEQQRLTPAERDNLVAYLDGELGEGEARAIATKLTHSPTARREVEALQKTWELLEYLPRPKVSEDFTARTLTEVQQLAAEGGKFEAIARQVALRAIRVALGTTTALLAFGLGFLVTHWVWPNPTARLARDLPIAEHLEEYQDVGTFDFLSELVDSPEFNTDRD
jgi:anti-sigma factor RsiW